MHTQPEELVLRVQRDHAGVAGAEELDAASGLVGLGNCLSRTLDGEGAGVVAVFQEGGDGVVDHLDQHVAGLVVHVHRAVDEGNALADAARQLELEIRQAVIAHAAAKAHHGGLADVGALRQLADRQVGKGARVGEYQAADALFSRCE